MSNVPPVDGCEHCAHEKHGHYHWSHSHRYPQQPVWREGDSAIWIEQDHRFQGVLRGPSNHGVLEKDGGRIIIPLPPEVVKAFKSLKRELDYAYRRASGI